MQILIYHPYITQRGSCISFDNMFNTSGFSGTEASILEIFKYLIDSCNFKVDVVGMTLNTYIDHSSGIHFYTLDDFARECDYNKYDWFSPLFYVYDSPCHQILSSIKSQKTKILLWMHCFISNDVIIHLRQCGFDVYSACVSEWVRCQYTQIFDEKHMMVVSNGVSPQFYKDVSLEKCKGKWCFHATFERGGHVAMKVFDKVAETLPDSATTFHTLSYYIDNSVCKYPSHVVNHGSLSKSGVANVLASSEYFVYPLVLPNNNIHHDTFGCVILEALAMGVIVITWKVACIPSVYEDYVIALEPPADYYPDARFMSHWWFNSDEAASMMAQRVIELEQNEEEKIRIRERGMIWARDIKRQWSTSALELEKLLRN